MARIIKPAWHRWGRRVFVPCLTLAMLALIVVPAMAVHDDVHSDYEGERQHHLFRRAGVEERVNLQRDGSYAKSYQVKQVRAVIMKHRLGEIE